MPVSPQAFLDIESSLADRLYSQWQKESRPLLRKIWASLEQGDTSSAIHLANGINLSSLVEKNADYIDYLSTNAILFGATRVTPDPRKTTIPGGNFDDVLASSQHLLRSVIKYNVEDYLRFTLLEAIAAYDLDNPVTNFSAPDGPLADYVLKYDPITTKGGEGSGHHGHAGRPGERGGSAPAGEVEGGEGKRESPGRQALRSLFGRISKPDGGFTYQPTTGAEPTRGFALSIYPDRSFAKPVKDLTEDDVADYALKNIDLLRIPEHHLGAWHDPDTGNVFLDVSMVTQDEKEAESLALKYDQIAYFDLEKGKSTVVNREAQSGAAAKKGVRYGRGSAETDIASSSWEEGSRFGFTDGALYQADGQATDARGDGADTQEAGEREAVTTKWDEADHPRDEAGRFTVAGSQGDLPSAPGTTPIPEGHVRLYHQTGEAELQSIARTGLSISHAKGIEGPRAIYAGETGFYGKPEDRPTLEFHVPKDKWSLPFVRGDVPPSQMLAVHLPWHGHARYIEENPDALANVLEGRHDWLMDNPDSPEGKAIAYIKRRHAKKYDPDQPRDENGRWTSLGAMLGALPTKDDPNLRAEASTVTGRHVLLGPKFYNLSESHQKEILTHEAGHFHGMDDWYLANHEDWDLAAKTKHGNLNGQTTPGEIIVEAYSLLWHDPEFLKANAPDLIPLVESGAEARNLPLPKHVKKYDEALHPRDEQGRWTDSGGETRSAGGTAYFKQSLGIKRKDMPQIAQDDLPEFTEWAAKQGVAVRLDTENVSSLHPAQNEYNPANAAQLPQFALDKPLTISRDNYVLDGTNRWVRQRNDDPGQRVAVRRIDLPAKEALKLMLRFPKAFSKDVGDVGRVKKIDYDEWLTKYAWDEEDEEKHPRAPAGTPEGGQWSKMVREQTEGITYDPQKKTWVHPRREVTEREIAVLRSFPVPPAWVNVHVNPDPTAPLQVLGQDAAERWQPKYSVEHTKAAAVAKFARGRDYNAIAPRVTEQIEKDLTDPDKVHEAAAMRLIQQTGIRIGGEKGEGVAHTAIGASTLKGQHVKIDGDKITLNFTGKSGVRQHHTITDPVLSSYLRGRGLEKGKLVFDTTDAKMREYFKNVTGDRKFLVKDVRMWVGTATAIKELKKVREPKNEKEFKEMAKAVATKVSKILGNTPAMSLKSYIDPLVWQPWNAKFPNALEPKKKVKKSETLDEIQALNDEFYELVSFIEPIPYDWREMPETAYDPDDNDPDATHEDDGDDPLELRKQVGEVEQKAETSRGAGAAQIVHPFVSFRELANNKAGQLLQLISGLHTSRLSAYGFTIEASVTGVTTYAISAQLDNRVCDVCAYLHGMEFQVEDAVDALGDILKADDPEDLRTLQPWPRQDEQNLNVMYEMTPEELVDRNWHIPPYHPNCRCLLVKVEDVHEIEATPSYRAAFPERA